MKNLALVAASMMLLAFSNTVHARGGGFTVYSNAQGYANCEDEQNGGERGARLESCTDIAHGRNHSCEQAGNGCLAHEGKGNNGNAMCAAQCVGHRHFDDDAATADFARRPPRPPGRGGTFVVAYYGQQYTRCDDRNYGGRPGARVEYCNDIAHGRNHRCDNVGSACLATEGNGNNGNAACDAVCR